MICVCFFIQTKDWEFTSVFIFYSGFITFGSFLLQNEITFFTVSSVSLIFFYNFNKYTHTFHKNTIAIDKIGRIQDYSLTLHFDMPGEIHRNVNKYLPKI